jgi:G3E family GTPase
MKKIPFFLVTGFLGSGKTTFLKQFLTVYADRYRIVVIQNEFAPGNIDGKFLAQCGKKYTLFEINRGSVFCVCLLADFKETLLDIITSREPEIIILEATGLADPIAIGQFIEMPEIAAKIYLAHIWCIADTAHIITMQERYPRVNHQLRVADTILLNKSDTCHGVIDDIKQALRAINPYASIIAATHCKTELKVMDRVIKNLPVALQQKDSHAKLSSSGRPQEIGFAVIKSTRTINRYQLELFLKEKEQEVQRIKGVVRLDDQRTVAVQSCFGDTTITPITDISGPTELIALGFNLDNKKFRDDFRKTVES